MVRTTSVSAVAWMLTIGLAVAQTSLRVRPLPELPEVLPEGLREGEHERLAEMTFAAELGPHDFDFERDFAGRTAPGQSARLGDGMASLAAKKIAAQTGVRGWLHVRVEKLADRGYRFRLSGAELDDDWQRHEWAVYGWCNLAGHLEGVWCADSRLPEGELRQLVIDEGEYVLQSTKGRRSKEVARLGSEPLTVPPVVRSSMPWLGAESVDLRPLDLVRGEVVPVTLARDDAPCAWPRTDRAVADLRQQMVDGGKFRFGFQKVATGSLVKTNKKVQVPALGISFTRTGYWLAARETIPAFGTVLHDKSDQDVVLRLLATPVDPGTTLAEFTRPKESVKLYQVERKPIGKPRPGKVDGYPALLTREAVTSWGKDYVGYELRWVADGVGFTFQVQAPKAAESAGSKLIKKLQRSKLRE